ncbi:MAG: histidine kinase N-terminal 7TM domain-containing protein [Salinirussus sp.]
MTAGVPNPLAWPVLGSLSAGVGSLLLLAWLWGVRDRPGARWFLLTIAVGAVTCLSYAAGLTVVQPDLRWTLEVITAGALLWLGAPFLAFALSYTGRSELLGAWWFRLLIVGQSLLVLGVATNPLHQLFWSGFRIELAAGVVGARYAFGPLAFVAAAVDATTVAAATGLLFETVLSYGPLYRREALAVGVSPLPPAFGLVTWLLGIGPLPAINLAPVLFLPHVVLDGYAFVRGDMFDYHPATRRAAERSAFEELGSPVVVLDRQGRVVDLNSEATSLLADGGDPVTEPVESLLGAEIDLDGDGRRFAIDHDGSRREYAMTPAPLTDSGDNHVGYTLLLQDVTEEIRREQRLSVLNRVLRHNLRNDLGVVRGNVATARERVDSEVIAEMLASAESTAGDLLSTGEKARTVAETVREDERSIETVDVGRLCVAVAAAHRERCPERELRVEDGTSSEIRTDRALLEAVLDNLVENAVEHGDGTVTVCVERVGPARVTSSPS